MSLPGDLVLKPSIKLINQDKHCELASRSLDPTLANIRRSTDRHQLITEARHEHTVFRRAKTSNPKVNIHLFNPFLNAKFLNRYYWTFQVQTCQLFTKIFANLTMLLASTSHFTLILIKPFKRRHFKIYIKMLSKRWVFIQMKNAFQFYRLLKPQSNIRKFYKAHHYFIS